ncbi:ribonuclease Z [Trypanosoma conorhini]|uniref:ribonuclease Z n=1 Tax=Trypanosoma conorhini TaxID=83891 RepID=A0A3S5IRR5_9TRYP|nr:ribonuclease Z [Trypanosoma conorhini]RNF08363.1 ribonuclease Z [Trypanosoma conorhini]
MSADYIQLVGTDVPGSYGSCCFSGQVQHEALRCPAQPLALAEASPPSSEAASAMSSDGQLLFFNCPEGVQRFSSEANVRLVRTRGFFFTRWAVSAVMGMPGLLFTINDAGVRHANFFGPSSHSLDVEDGAEGQARRAPLHAGRAAVAGLEGMLEALRRHYFWYRPMSFQQLRAGGAVLRQLPTTLRGNYVCEVPLRPLAEQEGGPSAPPPPGVPASASSASFFVLSLRLSPTSALLGFRVPRTAAAAEEETYGYALVHAPTACFDPQRAKALGVPAGPMYGQLKQGTGVWIDDEQGAPHGTRAAEKPRRFISPHSVKQATVGSRCMYVSLVLDGDDCEEVAAALVALFGRDAPTCEGQCDAGGERLRCGGELRRFLAQWQPSLLFRDDHHAASASAAATATAPTERAVVLTHVVHVQQSEFFAPFKTDTAGAAEAHYVTSIFAGVRRGVREQAVQCFRNEERGGDAGATAAPTAKGTRHHFCAAVQQEFSAFPTALAHRYHLNCIAEAQFPMADSFSAEKKPAEMSGEPGPIWPYSVKHPLVPAEAATRITDHANTSAMGSVPPVAAPSLLVPAAKQLKKSGNLSKGETAGLLRYPTARSAVEMLSAQFRTTVGRAREQMPGVLASASSSLLRHPQGDPRERVHDACGRDDGNSTWHLDDGGALTFLGTGSAVPSKYRNVSGTYLEVMYHARRGKKLCRAVVVLDFGEGNAGQLAMLWGNGSGQALRRFFNDLAFVFISHAHADHHLGLMTLLELRHRLRLRVAREEPDYGGTLQEPVLVVCPQEVHEFMQDTWGRCAAYRRWLQEEVVYDVIPAERHRAEGASATAVLLPRLDAVCARLGENTAVPASSGECRAPPPLWGAEVFPVHHPANAHALLLRFPAPMGAAATSRVFLFSGDTRPSPFLIERCRRFTRCTHYGSAQAEGRDGTDNDGDEATGVFLCLHEATFGEGCEEEAVQKCHSTLPEALQVAAAIRAEHIVLNHFSQRYPKLPGLMQSQLDGRDVDVRCRRRKLRGSEPATAPMEQSRPEEAAGVPAEVRQGDSPRRQLRDASGPDAGPVGSGALRMCFGFDFMRLSFASLQSRETAQLTPLFVQLLEEYESWGVGTTKRLRD